MTGFRGRAGAPVRVTGMEQPLALPSVQATAAALTPGRVKRGGGARTVAEAAVTAAVVGLTLATAWIHLQLGGWLFVLNALGYATLAAALVVPVRVLGRERWLVRIALLGFTTATIVGWAVVGPRYGTAYIAKAIEVAVVVLLVTQLSALDGGPRGLVANARRLLATGRRFVAETL